MDGNQAARELNTLTYNTYITDRLKAGDINRIIYKPTRNMESDYLTKTLQRKAFHTHRKTLMGLDGIDEHCFTKNIRMKKSQQMIL